MNTQTPDPATNPASGGSVRSAVFGGQPAVELAAPDGARAMVLLHGGQLVSWTPAGAPERLYLSPRASFGPGVSVRGGVPIVFPQFAQFGPLPRHGFARTREWTLAGQDAGSDDALAVLRLADDEATRALWPHAFVAELTLRVGGARLDVELAVENTGDDPLQFTAALHSYLRVADLGATRLQGLERLRYRDQVRGTEQVEGRDGLRFDGEVDRIYFDAARALHLHDGARSLRILAEGFGDVVVWNPGPGKAASLTDLPPDAFRHFACVEAAAIGNPIRLEPGDQWSGRQSLIDETANEPR